MGKLVDAIKSLPSNNNGNVPKWAANPDLLEAIDNWIQGGYVSQVFHTKTELYRYLCGQSLQYPRATVFGQHTPACRTFHEFVTRRASDLSKQSLSDVVNIEER